MKPRIETQLKDGESGRIDRRQILRMLGLSAAGVVAPAAISERAAAFAGADQAAPPEPRKAFPVTTMNHLSYAVTNYARTRDWYVELFGMRIAWDNGKECALEFGSLTSPEGMYVRPVAAGGKPNVNHFGFGMRDIIYHLHFMQMQMERWGLKNIKPDGELGWIASDPAGYNLDPWIPEKDPAMFPGAAGPCKVADSPECREGYAAGLKGLDKLPKPSGKGFTATSFSYVVLRVPQSKIAVGKEFYRDLMGMNVIYDQPDRVFLRYGKNSQFLLPTPNPGDKPYCNEFGFVIENFDSSKVQAELTRRGLNPKPYSHLAWTITDPEGLQIQVAAWGLPEHLANECKGSVETCPVVRS